MWKQTWLQLSFLALCLSQVRGSLLNTSHTFCVSETSSQLVPADEGDNVELLCRRCSSSGSHTAGWTPDGPRVWYHRDLLNGSSEEVPITVNSSSGGHLLADEYVLVIKNFKGDIDSKLYGCHSLSENQSQSLLKIEYFVDALVPSLAGISVLSGNVSKLAKFEQEHLQPATALVQKELSATMFMQWGQQSLCQGCLEGASGHKNSRGRCALRTSESKFPHNITELSCRSMLLQGLVSSELRAQLLGIPEFDLIESCECPKTTAASDDAEGKQELIFFLREGSTWDIKCPYMEYPGAHVDWYRDERLMNVQKTQLVDPECGFWCKCGSLFVSPHSRELTVQYATRSIAGNYSCRAANKDWSFQLKVYDSSETCSLSNNAIMLVVGLLLLPVFITCCMISRLCWCSDCCPEEPAPIDILNTSLDSRVSSHRSGLAVLLPVPHIPVPIDVRHPQPYAPSAPPQLQTNEPPAYEPPSSKTPAAEPETRTRPWRSNVPAAVPGSM